MTSSSEDETDQMNFTPETKEQETNRVTGNLLPKSQEKYLRTYESFMSWRNEKLVETFSESHFITYFKELSEKFQPSTLWAIYSMLKSTVHTKHNVDIKNFPNLTILLKRLSRGFKSKKSKVFTRDDVETFLNQAPDDTYLATKVALIFGIRGACKGTELANMTIEDIEVHNKLLLIKIPNKKTRTERTFMIQEEFTDIVRKYQALRPSGMQTKRFFLNVQKGKCTKQVIGKNKFANMPKQIATYLKLPNPEHYTGRCFHRTSATLPPDLGTILTKLKHQTAEECTEDLVEDESNISTINLSENENSSGLLTNDSTESESELASPDSGMTNTENSVEDNNYCLII